MLLFSATLRLPHILLRLEGIKSKLLNTLARLSSKDFFNPRRLSLHPLKGVYTPFSRGPFGTCPAFNQSHVGGTCAARPHDIYSQPLQLQTSLRRVCVYLAWRPHILFTPRQLQVNLHYSRLLHIFGCAPLAAYTVQKHLSTCQHYFTLRIFGCTPLAAYTVAPRQSKWNRLVVFYLEIYACLTALTVARGLHSSKQVYSASFHLYLTSLHFHLFRNMNVPCGT